MYNSQYCQVPEDPIQPPLTITMIYRSPFYEEGTNSPTPSAVISVTAEKIGWGERQT